MNQMNWTLSVKNFGKIKSAEIEVKPLMLFLGDNNSGKSYLLSLIWGIINNSNSIVENLEAIDSDAHSECRYYVNQIIENLIQQKTRNLYTYELEEGFINALNLLINQCLEMNKVEFLRTIFSESVEAETIKVEFNVNKKVEYKLLAIDKEELVEVKQPRIENKRSGYINFENKGMLLNLDDEELQDKTIRFILESLICDSYKFLEGATYLPASRTGFVLTFKTLSSVAIKNNFGNKVGNTLLTSPFIQFIELLSGLKDKYEIDPILENEIAYQGDLELAKYIEEFMINGHISVSDMPLPDFKYIPEGSNNEIPMFLSSAVVTELTPLILFLKNNKVPNALLIEEPEMCLHPALQASMAKVLIRMVNTGKYVFATTHSADFLEHVNNMIRLANHPNKYELMKNYKYEQKDLLDNDQIGIYQFDHEGTKTIVNKLVCSNQGFSIPTFQKALKKTLDETWAFSIEE